MALSVQRAARWVPFDTQCLHRAMALVWLAKRAGLPYRLHIAARPPNARSDEDALHAWVDMAGETVLGSLPGPWVVTLVLSGPCRPARQSPRTNGSLSAL